MNQVSWTLPCVALFEICHIGMLSHFLKFRTVFSKRQCLEAWQPWKHYPEVHFFSRVASYSRWETAGYPRTSVKILLPANLNMMLTLQVWLCTATLVFSNDTRGQLLGMLEIASTNATLNFPKCHCYTLITCWFTGSVS